MTKLPESPGKTAARASREKRLAEALRANLKRRKAAAFGGDLKPQEAPATGQGRTSAATPGKPRKP